ncbi:MAG: amidase family protein [Gammaproteobacteria bacterium]|nr:amidase family protein [Gammaproteobacteria bacterium]
MKKSEYQQYDGLGLADLVRKKEVTADELMQIALELAEESRDSINATADINAQLGQENARHPKAGMFSGVSFLVKEILAYPGLKNAMGSRLFAQHLPQQGTAYTDRIDGAGLVTFGNTTGSEFGLLGSTETELHSITRNPLNENYSAAGSLGGSAAAGAAGIVPMAHASDGGGSIRIPASVFGLFWYYAQCGALCFGGGKWRTVFRFGHRSLYHKVGT